MGAILGVGVQGIGPINCQWLRDGVVLTRQTQASCGISGASAITSAPAGAAAVSGAAATFLVLASATASSSSTAPAQS